MTATSEITVEQTEPGTSTFYQFEDGMYDAVISNIEMSKSPFEEDKEQLQFDFEVPGYQNDDGTTASKRGWANVVFNSQSKLWKWTAAVLGVTTFLEGEQWRASMLLGKPCRIYLKTEPNKAGDGMVQKLKDVLGPAAPAKAAPKKAGLVARLREEQPENVSNDLGPCIVCDEPGTAFSPKGKPLCEAHKSVA